MRALRGAIVGCGYFSQFHVDAWRRMPGVTLAAACDRDLTRAQAVADRAYGDAAEMLEAEELDFLDIATPPPSHLPLLRMATGKRIPVIVQKPLAPTWADVREASKIATESGV